MSELTATNGRRRPRLGTGIGHKVLVWAKASPLPLAAASMRWLATASLTMAALVTSSMIRVDNYSAKYQKGICKVSLLAHSPERRWQRG